MTEPALDDKVVQNLTKEFVELLQALGGLVHISALQVIQELITFIIAAEDVPPHQVGRYAKAVLIQLHTMPVDQLGSAYYFVEFIDLFSHLELLEAQLNLSCKKAAWCCCCRKPSTSSGASLPAPQSPPPPASS